MPLRNLRNEIIIAILILVIPAVSGTYLHQTLQYQLGHDLNSADLSEDYVVIGRNHVEVFHLDNCTVEELCPIEDNAFLDIWQDRVLIGSFFSPFFIANITQNSYYEILNTSGIWTQEGNIDQDRICYSVVTQNKSIIMIYELNSNHQYTLPNPMPQSNPCLYRDSICWFGCNDINSSVRSIFITNLNTNESVIIHNDTRSVLSLRMNKHHVSWISFNYTQPDGDEHLNLYLFDLKNQSLKTIRHNYSAWDMFYKHDSTHKYITWLEHVNSTSQIFLYNLENNLTIPLTDSENRQLFPRIHKEKIIWFEWTDFGYDLHMIQLDLDFDNDTIPDIYDNDDDNDNYSDKFELKVGTNPLDQSDHPPSNGKSSNNYSMLILFGITNIIIIIILFTLLKKRFSRNLK